MYILLLWGLCLASLHFSWSRMITRAIKREDGAGEKWGDKLIPFAFIWIIVFWVVLTLGGQHSWKDSEPAITAIVITLATFFSYGKVLSPSFYGAYLNVTDCSSGVVDNNSKLSELTITKGKWRPVFLAVYNTGITTWDNYRITIGLPDGFEVSETAPEFPNSSQWNWAPESGSLKIGQKPCYVQKRSSNILAIGETSATRFFVKANHSGRFRMKIMVTTVGRVSERRQWLYLSVKD